MTDLDEDAGVIRIDLAAGLAGRLFGGLFLIVGLWLVWQLILSLLDVVLGPAPVGEVFVGIALLAALTPAFLVPGWLLALSRARVEIEQGAGRVTEIRDLLITERRTTYPLSAFDRIAVEELMVSPTRRSSNSRVSFQVQLHGPGSRSVMVALAGDGEEAMRLGGQLGRRLGLRVDDRRFAADASEV